MGWRVLTCYLKNIRRERHVCRVLLGTAFPTPPHVHLLDNEGIIFLELALETREHDGVMKFRLYQRWPPKIMIWKSMSLLQKYHITRA